MLLDGQITDREYQRLFSLFVECLHAHRIGIDKPVLSPMDGRRMLWWPSGGKPFKTKAEFDATNECQLRYLAIVEASGIALEPKAMEEGLRRYVDTCLHGVGIDLGPNDRDLRSMMQAVKASGAGKLQTCVFAGMAKVHPEIPIVQFTPPEVY